MKHKKNNKPRECTICGKPFHSGKAIGGHMRAHFVNHPIPPSAAIIKKKARDQNSAESTHNRVAENIMLNSSASTRTRSKSRRRFMAVEKEAEAKEAEVGQPVSSISDPEVKYAAEILMDIQFAWRWLERQEAEMSRGSMDLTKREPRLSVNLVEGQEDSIQLNEFHNEEEAKVLTPDKPLGLFQTLIETTHTGARFNREICNEIFISNQALSFRNREKIKVTVPEMQLDLFPPLIEGTRNESRFKTKTRHQALSFCRESQKEVVEDNEDDVNGSGRDSSSVNDAVQDETRHQCPVCFKVFTSGQGLGGHKRVHMANASAARGNKSSAAKKFRLSLDLNLPAPDELEEKVISTGDLSTSSSDKE